MKPQTLLEILDAGHLSAYVDGEFKARGGLMIVGPPGVLKSTMIELAYQEYPNALVLSDLNVNQLMGLRDDLISGRYRTIAFTEFEKLYQRHSSTASNIEGHLKALAEEGFTRASFEDQRMSALKARSLIVGAMTYSFYANRYRIWAESGFARRFLWCTVNVKDPDRIPEAIHKWEKIEFDGIPRRSPTNKNIPYSLTDSESSEVRLMLRDQVGLATPFILAKKMYCALKWKYKDTPKAAKKIMEDASPMFSKNGGLIDL